MKSPKHVLLARRSRREAQASRRALLIVGSGASKTAPPDATPEVPADAVATTGSRPADAMQRVGDLARLIVDALAAHGIHVEVHVTLRRKQATRVARDAARAGVQLVIAGGGDETISAVARGLVGTKSVLGIVPLDVMEAGSGRPNGSVGGIASFLGVPEELGAACDLMAASGGLPIDVGQVTVAEHRTSRLFFSRGAVGLTAAMMPAAENAAARWWGGPVKSQPAPPHLTPTQVDVRVDNAEPGRSATTLLVEIDNIPRGRHLADERVSQAGEQDVVAGASAAVRAGGLDVRIYHDADHEDLAARFAAAGSGHSRSAQGPEEALIEHTRATRVDVRTAAPMPVTADWRVIGTTPARFDLLPAALLVALSGSMGLDGSGSLAAGALAAHETGPARRPARPVQGSRP